MKLSVLTFSLLGLLCLSQLMAKADKPEGATEESQEQEVVEYNDIVFAEPGGVKLLLDLQLPAGVARPPLVMFIHGGAYLGGNRKSTALAWLVDEGYAIARIEYRVSSEAIFPAQIHDCKGALRWLRAHQNEYGFNAERVVVAGTSAGGHLAALLGVSGEVEALEGTTAGHAEESSQVQGAIDYFGATDFILRSNDQPAKTEHPRGAITLLLGGPVSKNRSLARLASPVTHVTADDPPLLIFHGEKDPVVHLSQSQRLLEVCQAKNHDTQLLVIPGQGHGWKGPTSQERLALLRFLAKHLR